MSSKLLSHTQALYFLGWQQIKRNQVKSNIIFLRIGKNPLYFGKNRRRVEQSRKPTKGEEKENKWVPSGFPFSYIPAHMDSK